MIWRYRFFGVENIGLPLPEPPRRFGEAVLYKIFELFLKNATGEKYAAFDRANR